MWTPRERCKDRARRLRLRSHVVSGLNGIFPPFLGFFSLSRFHFHRPFFVDEGGFASAFCFKTVDASKSSSQIKSKESGTLPFSVYICMHQHKELYSVMQTAVPRCCDPSPRLGRHRWTRGSFTKWPLTQNGREKKYIVTLNNGTLRRHPPPRPSMSTFPAQNLAMPLTLPPSDIHCRACMLTVLTGSPR